MFTLSYDEAVALHESYQKEIENLRKNLDAVTSIAFLLETYIDHNKPAE